MDRPAGLLVALAKTVLNRCVLRTGTSLDRGLRRDDVSVRRA